MSRSLRLFFGLVSVSCCVCAQHFSYGVALGTALTDDVNAKGPFPNQFFFQEGIRTGGKSVIVGPVLQWNFTPHFAVEADGLFRELHFASLEAGSHNPTITWEFPVLAKYEFNAVRSGSTGLRPFLEAGPSFRTTGNLNTTPSHFGVSAGGGLEVRWRKIGFAPTVRYTRWRQDSVFARAPSRADQIEFLLAFTNHPDRDALPYSNRLAIGAVVGVNFLSDYFSRGQIFNSTDYLPGSGGSYSSSPGRRSVFVGPTLEVRLGRGLSVEGDAIYRPMRSEFANTYLISGQIFRNSGDSSAATWQFPVMAKYKFGVPFLPSVFKPFVLAGPSFRQGNSAGHYGVTAGVGVAARVHRLEIAPSLRYARWREPFYSSIKADELNLMVGFTF